MSRWPVAVVCVCPAFMFTGCWSLWVIKISYKIYLFEWKIFGLNKEASCIWRIESNKELNDLIKNRNMLNYFLIVFDFFLLNFHLNIFISILTNFML